MKQVVSATYKKLLAGARKVDSDPALRAMLATAPLGKGREVDSSERSESESQHEVHIQSLLRKLNGNCERYHPERPVDPSLFHLTSEKAPSPGKPSSRSDKPSLGTFVQKTFRRSVLSSGSLDSAFAALKLINGVLDMQRHLPSAPSYPGRSLGFQVMPCVTRKDVDLALRDPPFCRSPFLDAVRARRLNLLVAHPMRQGFFFQHSIVLVAALHKAEAIGFIINKPLTADDSVPLRVGDTVPETFHRLFHTHLKDHPVMLGGAAVFVPSMDLAVALVHRIPGVVGAKVLAPGLWLNGSFEALSAKLDAKVASPSDVMFVTGCCLWKANELEREICHQGRWIVLVKEAVDPKAPSVEPATEITERDLSLYEEDPADLKARADAYLKLVSQPEDPVAAGECARLVLGTQAACLDRRSARAGKQEGSKDGDCKCPFPKQLWVEVLGGLNPEYRAMSRISDVEALQGKGDEE